MNDKQVANGIIEWLKVQERALSDLADSVKKHEVQTAEDIKDLQTELKALKVFLARNIPEFKEQFPEIEGKVK
ncbi:MAG: hypothetical protein WA946_00385 [Nitrospirota bacterium]